MVLYNLYIDLMENLKFHFFDYFETLPDQLIINPEHRVLITVELPEIHQIISSPHDARAGTRLTHHSTHHSTWVNDL